MVVSGHLKSTTKVLLSTVSNPKMAGLGKALAVTPKRDNVVMKKKKEKDEGH